MDANVVMSYGLDSTHEMVERDRVDSWAMGMALPLRYTKGPIRPGQPRLLFENVLNGNAAIFEPQAPVFHSMPKVPLAVGNVLSTPELLAAILCNLPTCALLSAQRISKTWQAAIVGSKDLQQRLFCQAGPPTHHFLITKSILTSIAFIPHHRNRVLTIVQDRVSATTKAPGYLRMTQATLNPLLCTLSAPDQQIHLDSRAAHGERLQILPSALQIWLGSTRAPPSAWNMFLTQPPAMRATLSIFDDRNTANKSLAPHRKVVLRAGGIRFGDVMEAYGNLLTAWKTSLKEGLVPEFMLDAVMRDAPVPEVFLLCEPAGEDVGNAILVAGERDMELIESRAERALVEKGIGGVVKW